MMHTNGFVICTDWLLNLEISFGRIIKGKFQECREPSGERRTMWKGIKLKEEYCIDMEQQQLPNMTW